MSGLNLDIKSTTLRKGAITCGKQKKLIEHLKRLLLIKLENWKEYLQTRGIIDDFFKAAKEHLD